MNPADIPGINENTNFGGETMITNVQLTTKERYLLEDARNHEEQCIKKYENYTGLACDSELKAVFRANGQKEQEHLQIINELLGGKIPSMGSSSNQGNKKSSGQLSSQSTSMGSDQSSSKNNWKVGQNPQSEQAAIDWQSSGAAPFKATDKDLCTDALMTEKYVSAEYNTAIFEFRDAQIRDILNHIQKEEQKHGEAIFAYMQSTGMYKPS
jgi:spore coat protein CotF